MQSFSSRFLGEQAIPDYTTDLYDRRQEKLDRLRRRGKGPPKKGQGKRATKKGGKK